MEPVEMVVTPPTINISGAARARGTHVQHMTGADVHVM